MSIGESTSGYLNFGNTFGATSSSVSYSYAMPSGVEIQVSAKLEAGTKEISPSLYIKFVKSKLGKVQIERAKKRLQKLQKLVSYSRDMGQQALYEELTKEVAILVREAEMVAYKISTFVDIEHIKKFMGAVKDRVIKWEQLEKFPRVIPKSVQTKVKALQKAGIFDEYWILFIDYTKEEIKTNKEKIKNKDPILFGRLKYQPDRYYYIADWVDEYCDLTLDKFIEKFKADDPEFSLDEVPDIDQARWDNIVHEVKARVNRLEVTNASNWRAQMEEDEAAKPKIPFTELPAPGPIEKPKKKKWWPW